MKYDLQESCIATIRDEIPALKGPEQIRALCVDEDASDENRCTRLRFAQRIKNRIDLRWLEGQDDDEQYFAQLEPKNANDESDNDFWEWRGEVTAKYISYRAGLHADTPQSVTEFGKIAGLLFEQSDGVTFVGEITWNDSGERERVVIVLYESSG